MRTAGMMALGEHAGRTSAALATMARTLSPLTSPETSLFGCRGDASRSRVYQIADHRSKAGGGSPRRDDHRIRRRTGSAATARVAARWSREAVGVLQGPLDERTTGKSRQRALEHERHTATWAPRGTGFGPESLPERRASTGYGDRDSTVALQSSDRFPRLPPPRTGPGAPIS